VGVTPSTISQIESNLIYPSIPALIKIAETLSLPISSLFENLNPAATKAVFKPTQATSVSFPNMFKHRIKGKLLGTMDDDLKTEPYLIEIAPHSILAAHFFIHKGEEVGYLLTGELQMTLASEVLEVAAGDLIHLRTETPSRWENPGDQKARLLWMKICP
jgi:transcriptional regulator with XRE-family HTH domain